MAPTISPVFQRILVASQLEEAIINLLIEWFPDYLRELEKQLDLSVNSLVAPKNYTNRNSFDAVAGEETPKVVVISPGLVSAPTKTGEGKYRAEWRIGVGVAVDASTETEANMLVKLYGAGVRGIIMHNRSLGKFPGVVDTTWLDESYDDLPIPSQTNLYKAASLWFSVDVENVVTNRGGPTQPSQPVYDYPQVEHVIIDIVKEAIA